MCLGANGGGKCGQQVTHTSAVLCIKLHLHAAIADREVLVECGFVDTI